MSIQNSCFTGYWGLSYWKLPKIRLAHDTTLHVRGARTLDRTLEGAVSLETNQGTMSIRLAYDKTYAFREPFTLDTKDKMSIRLTYDMTVPI